MATTDKTAMKALLERLDRIADRITSEHNTEIPAERASTKVGFDLLTRLAGRESDLRVASKLHADAKVAFMAAKVVFETDSEALDTLYTEVTRLADQIEEILDYRRKPGDAKDTKIDKTGSDGKGKARGDEPKTEPTDGKGKGDADKKDGTSDTSTDSKPGDKSGKDDASTGAILAAIEAAQKKTVAALEPRLINADLATILNGLTPEQLLDVLNRRELTVVGAELVNVLGRYTPAQLADLLEGLNITLHGSVMERFRYARNARDNNRSGSHR